MLLFASVLFALIFWSRKVRLLCNHYSANIVILFSFFVVEYGHQSVLKLELINEIFENRHGKNKPKREFLSLALEKELIKIHSLLHTV